MFYKKMGTALLPQQKTVITEPHLSTSSIHIYFTCPRIFFYRYVRKIVVPPKSALTIGKAVHNTIQFAYTDKMRSKKDVNINTILEFFSANFDQLSKETVWKVDENPIEIKQNTLILVEKYHREIYPAITPMFVEEKFKIYFQDMPFTFVGTIDLVDSISNAIIDHKVLSKKPSPGQIDRDYKIQLAAYVLGYHSITGERIGNTFIDCLTKTKIPDIKRYPIIITDEDLKRFTKQIYATWWSIEDNKKRGIWCPNPYNFTCTPSCCGYWDICHKDW